MSRVYEAFMAKQMKPYHNSSKYVCADCLEDDFINTYIKSNGVPGICSFCGEEKSFIPVNNLLPRLAYYLDCMYTVNDNDAPVDGGEYLWDNGEFFCELVEELLPDANDTFVNHLISCWKPSDFYYQADIKLVEYEGWELLVSWENFKNTINKQANGHVICLQHDDKLIGSILQAQHSILEYISGNLLEIGGIRRIPAGFEIYRAREGKWEKAKDLGVPPDSKCNSNRLSFKGQPCFYGSLSPTTCEKEINLESGQDFTIGKWCSTRELCVIDLSDPIYYAEQKYDDYKDSIWDQEKLSLFPTISFLAFFAKEISKPADENEDYLPTQVVSEYFRRKNNDNKIIDGIIYRSAKNIAIFCGQNDCCNYEKNIKGGLLLLQSTEKRISS